MIVDMRHPVGFQYLPILRTKETSVPDLNGIVEFARKLFEKTVQPNGELVYREIVPLKLKQKWTSTVLELGFSKRSKHEVLEELRIEKARIGLTGFQAVPRV